MRDPSKLSAARARTARTIIPSESCSEHSPGGRPLLAGPWTANRLAGAPATRRVRRGRRARDRRLVPAVGRKPGAGSAQVRPWARLGTRKGITLAGGGRGSAPSSGGRPAAALHGVHRGRWAAPLARAAPRAPGAHWQSWAATAAARPPRRSLRDRGPLAWIDAARAGRWAGREGPPRARQRRARAEQPKPLSRWIPSDWHLPARRFGRLRVDLAAGRAAKICAPGSLNEAQWKAKGLRRGCGLLLGAVDGPGPARFPGSCGCARVVRRPSATISVSKLAGSEA